MIGFSQANDSPGAFTPILKDRPMTTHWSDPTTSSTNDFCDEIDEIMKHEHEDVILFNDSLSVTPLELDLDSISDLLENPSSSSTTSFTSPLNINDLPPLSTTFIINNNSQRTSAYSSLGISPKFTTLSINNNPSIFFQSNNIHLLPYIQQQQQQQDNSILGTSYPFELQSNTNGPSDVKRFRSASMNDGPSLQQNKLDPHLFNPNRLKSSACINRSSFQNKTTSPTVTNDTSSNPLWPSDDCPRPTSISFSEVENQQQQIRINTNLSSSYGGSPSVYSLHHRNQTGNFQPQTLYSLNQPTNDDTTPPNRKRSSLADFPVEEIKDDLSSPSCTLEQQSEPDLWSDIEQNSSDHIQDNDITSDDDTTVSPDFNSDPTKNDTNSSASRFWQYNVQSKGPKTKRILYLKERDPHLYREFSDPVYQIKLTQTKGQTTFNKLRKGDGNDVTPNPMKLYQLGKQIRDLLNNSSSVYHGIYHVDHHTNNNDTAEVKKEKNKIASRACRLRKKAQHEANKLKLHGLNEEHKSLIDLIASIKLIILKRNHDGQLSSPSSSPDQSLEAALDQLIATKYNQQVAGNADGFVQAIINDMEQLYAPKQQRSYSLNT